MILSIIFIILSIYLISIIYEMNKPAYKLAFRLLRISKNRFKKKLDNIFNKE